MDPFSYLFSPCAYSHKYKYIHMLGACSTTFDIWQVSIRRLLMLPMSNKMELQEGGENGEEIMQMTAQETLSLNLGKFQVCICCKTSNPDL